MQSGIITFEGGEGAGKSTQAALLKKHLEDLSKECILLREPGGCEASEKIRKIFLENEMDAMSELMLVLAARRLNIKNIIEPALAANKIVIIDRFIDSTLVYQGIAGGLGIAFVKAIMKKTQTWLEPDITFVMDIKPQVAKKRYTASDRLELKPLAFHEKLRKGFLKIAREKRHHIIDASATIEQIHKAIIEAANL